MTVSSMAVGGVTDTTARFNAKVTDGSIGVSVRYSTSPDVDISSSPVTATVSVNGYNAATCEATGLEPDTRYWWRGRDDGTTDTAITGTFVTDPVAAGTPASFTIAVGGDAGATAAYPGIGGAAVPGRISNSPVFDLIRERALAERWRRLVHLGDWCYYDLGSGNHGLSASATISQYRSMYDDLYAQTRQHELYRSVPTIALWGDHDFGPNNSDSTAPGRDNACTAYRERWPAYDLPAGAGANPIFHSFDIGRVVFAAFDERADRVTGSTLLGAAQLAWFENLLQTSTASALVMLMPTPWISTSSDTWNGFPAERDTLVTMLGDHGWLPKTKMMIADTHASALMSPAANIYGGFPVTLCATLDGTISSSSGPAYDLAWHPGRGQYVTLQVDDTGTDIVLTSTLWRGRRATDWQHLTVAA